MGVVYEMNNEKWVWLLEKSPLLENSGSAPEVGWGGGGGGGGGGDGKSLGSRL